MPFLIILMFLCLYIFIGVGVVKLIDIFDDMSDMSEEDRKDMPPLIVCFWPLLCIILFLYGLYRSFLYIWDMILGPLDKTVKTYRELKKRGK